MSSENSAFIVAIMTELIDFIYLNLFNDTLDALAFEHD